MLPGLRRGSCPPLALSSRQTTRGPADRSARLTGSPWIRQLFQELKRRNVYKVAVAYAAVAFAVWQPANLLFPALRFPAWTSDFVIVLTLLGFSVVLVIAWAFEVTPEGVQRTADAEGASEPESMSPEERRTQSRLNAKRCTVHGSGGTPVSRD